MKTFKISKEFHFSASHQLYGLRAGHQCGRLHGHNYVIKVHLSSNTLDITGMVEDYGELRDVKEYIDGVLDHRDLNDMIPDMNPTAENLAKYLFEKFIKQHPLMTGITVKETPKTEAYYGS